MEINISIVKNEDGTVTITSPRAVITAEYSRAWEATSILYADCIKVIDQSEGTL